ncbi:MAG: CPBP family intramembrane metalloprotease [Nitrosopumilus sp.]|uniref:CPBP family intramembrane glutamic endopeptidase n=1 Tax=Nitrosopumilus sp. TaxID=2024843 RepID=UPI002470968B|nr:CPBP family intramembrane glutamic endopeptidase [Nitrosopumilus sp.]MDH5431013.1 CPBP family intramembrane metalloprotease [Nitrosopumilus sp.]MDH5664882.1 CPBP family intramembrane metalloprotease [Nitrosopumilus sp.]
MQNSNKLLQSIGIPFAALLSVVFGLLLVSFPIGIFVVFESDIGDDINYEYPFTHLDLFVGTDFYQAPIDVSIGDVFVVLWVLYLILFVIAILGPKHNFLKTLTPIISFGRYDDRLNYMIGVTKWFSILILISALINFVQEGFGIEIVPPLDDNDLIQFFYVSLAPLIEELGFRLLLVGIPLFALYSHKSSLRYFFTCLWNPNFLHIYDSKKAIILIIFVGILFGFTHVAFGDSWSEGKFAQATASGIILGWVYLRYGFVASLLIHWATNYFIFSYANFISQINMISINDAFSHSLMSTLELLLLISGAFSLCILFVNRFYSKKELDLEI